MIKGIHHVGLQAPNPAEALSPYAAFFGAPIQSGEHGAWVAAPNGFMVARQGAAPSRTASVHALGLAHVCIQSQAQAEARVRLEGEGVRLLADPVSLGTGFRYSYARDRDGRLIEWENAPFLSGDCPGWIAHVAFVTRDLDRITQFYSALLERPLSAGGRTAGNAGVDKIAQLSGVDLEPIWIRGLNLTLEFWRYYAPELSDPEEAQCAYTYLALEVEEPELVQARALALGATRCQPESVLGQAACAVLDPDGNRLVFLSPRQIGPGLADLRSPALIEHVLPARAAYQAQRAAERASAV